jgi:hypothetical protein
MNAEREREIREMAQYLSDRSVIPELLAALDEARAERDEFRAARDAALMSMLSMESEIERLKQERDDAVEALEFYANLGIPRGTTPVGDTPIHRDPYWQDQGKSARATLSKLKGNKQ